MDAHSEKTDLEEVGKAEKDTAIVQAPPVSGRHTKQHCSLPTVNTNEPGVLNLIQHEDSGEKVELQSVHSKQNCSQSTENMNRPGMLNHNHQNGSEEHTDFSEHCKLPSADIRKPAVLSNIPQNGSKEKTGFKQNCNHTTADTNKCAAPGHILQNGSEDYTDFKRHCNKTTTKASKTAVQSNIQQNGAEKKTGFKQNNKLTTANTKKPVLGQVQQDGSGGKTNRKQDVNTAVFPSQSLMAGKSKSQSDDRSKEIEDEIRSFLKMAESRKLTVVENRHHTTFSDFRKGNLLDFQKENTHNWSQWSRPGNRDILGHVADPTDVVPECREWTPVDSKYLKTRRKDTVMMTDTGGRDTAVVGDAGSRDAVMVGEAGSRDAVMVAEADGQETEAVSDAPPLLGESQSGMWTGSFAGEVVLQSGVGIWNVATDVGRGEGGDDILGAGHPGNKTCVLTVTADSHHSDSAGHKKPADKQRKRVRAPTSFPLQASKCLPIYPSCVSVHLLLSLS